MNPLEQLTKEMYSVQKKLQRIAGDKFSNGRGYLPVGQNTYLILAYGCLKNGIPPEKMLDTHYAFLDAGVDSVETAAWLALDYAEHEVNWIMRLT